MNGVGRFEQQQPTTSNTITNTDDPGNIFRNSSRLAQPSQSYDRHMICTPYANPYRMRTRPGGLCPTPGLRSKYDRRTKPIGEENENKINAIEHLRLMRNVGLDALEPAKFESDCVKVKGCNVRLPSNTRALVYHLVFPCTLSRTFQKKFRIFSSFLLLNAVNYDYFDKYPPFFVFRKRPPPQAA